jgi:Ca2+-binding EF-hand superfamily protein
MDQSKIEAYDGHLARYMETQDETELKAAFKLLDQAGNGLVSPEDYLPFSTSDKGPEEAKASVAKLFRAADLNQDGYLDEKEFVTLIQRMTDVEVVEGDPMSPEDMHFEKLLDLYDESKDSKHLEACFQLIDTNGDGVISLAELKQSYLCRGAKDTEVAARMVMSAGDLNQDGVLSLAEFVALVGEAGGAGD